MISYNTAAIEGAHRFSVFVGGLAMFDYVVGTSRSSEERVNLGDVMTSSRGQHADGLMVLDKTGFQLNYRMRSSYR